MKKIILSSLAASLLLVACKSTQNTQSTASSLTCDNTSLSFTKDIKPIMVTNCTKCHNGGKLEFNFNELTSVKEAVGKEEFLQTIKHMSGYPSMPKNADKLDQATIDMIECWIKNGMKE